MKKILHLLLTLTCINSFSQICGTPGYTSYENSNNLPYQDFSLPNNNTYCVKLKFHIVRKDDGSIDQYVNPITSSNINNVLNYLNSNFNNQGIYLINNGFDYINSTLNYNKTIIATNSQGLSSLSYDSNSINIYITRSVNNPFTLGVLGTKIFMDYSAFTNDLVTSVHELGHAFGLYHTFHGTNPNDNGGCYEIPNGTQLNSQNCGDFVTDTPSTDCNGSNGCNRDITNFMDYSSVFFGVNSNHFTNGQGLRMRNSIETTHYQRFSYKCKNINGQSYICPDEPKNYFITLYPNATVPIINWSVSSNLQIIGNYNTNTVSIKTLANTQNNVYGMLILTINGEVITKQIWIGAPTLSNNYSITGAYDWVSINYGAMGLIVPTNSTITSFLWTLEEDELSPICSNNSSLARFPTTSLQTPINNNNLETTTPYATINWGGCIGNYILTCYAKNDCGVNPYLVKYVCVGDPKNNPCYNNAFNLIVAPNPIRDGKIQISVNKNIKQSPCNYKVYYENSGFRFDLGITENHIFIYDYNGTLVYDNKYNTDDIVIDDANLIRGNYIINIFTREGGMDQTIIVID